ncbi:MAG: hypothetical protein IIU08_09350, partial [Clostridia bacterium]|nr:hypothetical protein [Clostridia bacterium]
GKIHSLGCGAIDDMDDDNKAITIDPEGLMNYDSKYSYCKRKDDVDVSGRNPNPGTDYYLIP